MISANSPISDSLALMPYVPPKSADVFVRSQIEKAVDQVYVRALSVTKTSERLLPPFDVIPKSSIAMRLQGFLNEMTKLCREGLFNGEVLIAKGPHILFGLKSRDVETVAEAGPGDPQFMIGSVSKQFFAVALLDALYHISVGTSEVERAADVQRLLHCPLSHFLPKEASLWGGVLPDWATVVTLDHLLSHTSGLPNYTEFEEYCAEANDGHKLCEIPRPDSIKEIIQCIEKRSLDFVPGSKFSYSNTGYRFVAEVITALTGMPASRYVRQGIFDQLGMRSTSNPDTGLDIQLQERNTKLVPQWGYDPDGDQTHLSMASCIREDMSWTQGDGSIISTASDLLTWNLSLHQKGLVLPPRLYELLITENLNGYAYGIERQKFDWGTVLSHTGLIGNYGTYLSFFPEHEISIVLFTNACAESSSIDREFEDLMESLEGAIPDEVKRKSAVKKAIDERHPDLRATAMDRIFNSLFAENCS